MKQAGERSTGNPHATFDEAENGNQLTVRLLRHSQRKRRETARHTYGEWRHSSTLLIGEVVETLASFEARFRAIALPDNRHEAEDERALRERSSDPLGLESCAGYREVLSEA